MERLRYLGFVEEAAFNESPEVATMHVDIASATLDAPTDTELVYAGGLGRGKRTHKPAFYSPAGNFVYAFDINTIGWLLKWLLGGYAFTEGVVEGQEEVQTLYLGGATGGTFVLSDGEDVTAPLAFDAAAATIETALEGLYGAELVTVEADTDFTITFAQAVGHSGLVAYFNALTGDTAPTLTRGTPYIEELNLHELYGTHDTILPSFCARIGKDNLDDTDFEHVFSGCTISQLVLAVSDGFAQATADILAAKDSKDTIQPIADLLLPTGYPLTFANVTLELNEVDASVNVKSVTITVNNNADASAGRSIGSRHPRRIHAGAREVTFDIEFYYEDIAQLVRLWGAASAPSADGVTEFSFMLKFDAGDAGELQIDIARAIYTAVPIQPSGNDEIVPTLAGTAFIDTVTLNDAVTEVDTDVLFSLKNDEAEMELA